MWSQLQTFHHEARAGDARCGPGTAGHPLNAAKEGGPGVLMGRKVLVHQQEVTGVRGPPVTITVYRLRVTPPRCRP